MDFELWSKLVRRDTRVDCIGRSLAHFKEGGLSTRPQHTVRLRREDLRVILGIWPSSLWHLFRILLGTLLLPLLMLDRILRASWKTRS